MPRIAGNSKDNIRIIDRETHYKDLLCFSLHISGGILTDETQLISQSGSV